MQANQSPESKPSIRVLSIDGGGIRGIAVARILEELEKSTNKRIHELFDVVVGTSTGGLLTIMTTVPQRDKNDPNKEGEVMTAEDAKNFYLNKGAKIFPKPSFIKEAAKLTVLAPETLFNFIYRTKYSGSDLENVVNEIYHPSTTMRNAKICAGVCTSDIRYNKSVVLNSVRAKKYGNQDLRHNAPIVQLARATSAAPTYFPPQTIVGTANQKSSLRRPSVDWNSLAEPEYNRKEVSFEDGGMTHNNPANLGLKLAKALLEENGIAPKDCDYQLVSIGTGTISGREDDPSIEESDTWKHPWGGYYDLMKRLVNFKEDPFGMYLRSHEVHWKVMEKLKEGNYIRVQFKVTEKQLQAMDDASQENMQSLIGFAEEFLFKDPSKVKKSGEPVHEEEYTDAFQAVRNLVKNNSNRVVLANDQQISN